jgi:hypothetical protein
MIVSIKVAEISRSDPFHKVDVLERKSINKCLSTFGPASLIINYQPIKGNKSAAHDADFRLLFLELQSEPQDKVKISNKVYMLILYRLAPGYFRMACKGCGTRSL